MDEITVTLTREQQCDHEWKEPLDSMCERDVYCVKCGVRLERYGAMARFEKAIVDGQPGSYYTCLECIDKILANPTYEEVRDAR